MSDNDTSRSTLVRLGDTDLTVADPAEDIRGHTVVDADSEEIGDVKGLMMDEAEHKVRFLEVGAGGFLGIGETTLLIPVDAITRIHDRHVHVDRARDHVAKGPGYDPALTEVDTVWEESYAYYGYMPFWSAGYVAPIYPRELTDADSAEEPERGPERADATRADATRADATQADRDVRARSR